MKKFELFENEVLDYDVDDLMETEINKFHKSISDINNDEKTQFRHWLRIYKTLNYDIFENIKITNVYRFSKSSAVIKLNYKGNVEYDFLLLNADDLTVRIISIKGDKLKKQVIRRLLIPQTAEEALMYAKSEITKELIDETYILFNKIQTEPSKHDITKKLHTYLNIEYIEPEIKEEPKQEEVKEEPKQEEEVKEESKQEKNKFMKFIKSKIKKETDKKESILIDLETDSVEEAVAKLDALIKIQNKKSEEVLKDLLKDKSL